MADGYGPLQQIVHGTQYKKSSSRNNQVAQDSKGCIGEYRNGLVFSLQKNFGFGYCSFFVLFSNYFSIMN
jgi:hypothetical protein